MAERTTAYIVTFGYAYEPFTTLAVFGTHEKAEAYCNAFLASPKGRQDLISEWVRTDEEDGSTCWEANNGHTELKIIPLDWEPEYQ